MRIDVLKEIVTWIVREAKAREKKKVAIYIAGTKHEISFKDYNTAVEHILKFMLMQDANEFEVIIADAVKWVITYVSFLTNSSDWKDCYRVMIYTKW